MNHKNDKISSYMVDLIERKEIAGAALIIRKQGERVFEACYGVSRLETGEPVTENTIFRLASMTKPIIAIAIMLLIERNQLSLNSSLVEFLPKFRGKEQVTILHLLNHCSGLGHGPEGLAYYERHLDFRDNLEKRMDRLANLPFDFPPGTETGYSPIVAFDLLGRIIEIVSGKTLQTFLQDHLFQPLGIRDITYLLTPEQETRLAGLYEAENGELTDVTATEPLFLSINPMTHGYYSGAAGLFGTLKEYDKIVRMLGGKGQYNGVRILEEETVRHMHTPGLAHDKELSPGLRWGLGMIVYGKEEETNLPFSEGSYGWSGAYGTHMFIDNEKEIEVVLMMNRSNIGGAGSYISRGIEKLTYELYS